ncbi:uncharacterized protein LOC124270492 [Haliotis rubra]|uniref:uncharacterized protein LOC124270492 n=1 Tax=Haliotis rubra TaxID=36100 RepID=UPI001EE62081|nr:uncharacterized protein LOC124270492 [Haliotis rubra]
MRFDLAAAIAVASSSSTDNGMHQYLNGSTVTCKYSAEFRGLVYKVNPHDLSCVYKRMFEMCATNALRDLEVNEWLHKMGADFGGPERMCASPVETERRHVASRLALMQSNSLGVLSLYPAEANKQTKHIQGWETCRRPHSSSSLPEHRFMVADVSRKETHRSQSALGKLECGGKDERLRPIRATSVQCRKATSSEVISNKQETSQTSSTYTFNLGTTPQISYRFLHHNDLDCYMEQYREQYTYKRLAVLRPNVNEMRPYQMTLPVSPLLRCFDMFGCIQPPPGCGPRMSLSRLQAAGSTPPGRTSPKKQIRKKVVKSSSPESRPYRQTSNVLAAENGVLKMEFQGQPLPQVLPPATTQALTSGRKSSTSVYSDPCLSSVSVGNIKIPIISRTRPTIPSNAHGTIYASSTETPTYVVSYHKNK